MKDQNLWARREPLCTACSGHHGTVYLNTAQWRYLEEVCAELDQPMPCRARLMPLMPPMEEK
jgi:hypothetical protein